MAIARATKGIVLLALLGAFSALVVGTSLNLAPRTAVAPGTPATLERNAEPAAPLFSRELEHFRILYEGGTPHAISDRVARVLESGYRTIGQTLNSYPSGPVTVVLYPKREFQDLTRSPSWATGRYDGRIRIAVGGVFESRDLDRIVTHELVHAVVASAAPRGVPAWLNEGLASYLESTDRSWAGEVIRQAGAIVALDSLANGFGGLDEQRALVAYAESATAAEILCAQLGPNIGSFLQMVGNGSSVDQALLEFHVQPNAFHAEWRRRVGIR